MDYSKYTFNQLSEALEGMDKNAYPDNYRALSKAIRNYPTEKLQTEAFIDKIASMGINQLKLVLVDTETPAHRQLLEARIAQKQKSLAKLKIWFKWLALAIISLVAASLIPLEDKSIPMITALLIVIGSIFMAVRQHRAFNRQTSAED